MCNTTCTRKASLDDDDDDDDDDDGGGGSGGGGVGVGGGDGDDGVLPVGNRTVKSKAVYAASNCTSYERYRREEREGTANGPVEPNLQNTE